jgi:Ca2+ transporting ATPase
LCLWVVYFSPIIVLSSVFKLFLIISPKKKILLLAEHGDNRKKATPFLISGSRVMEGSGLILVCCVGKSTQAGKLKLMLLEDTPATPLQVKLEQIANDIGKIGVVCAGLTVLAMMGHLIYMVIVGQMSFLSMESLDIVVDAFIIGITIIVVAVPEGLPLAVTIALAYSVGKMKDENNLVRHLSSCETMGGANNICSDKTGTLTQNRMKV